MGWFSNLVKGVAMVAAIVYTGGAAAALFQAGSLAATAITFGTRVLAGYVVSSLFARQPEDQSGASAGATAQLGNRVSAGAGTTNKLPVIYGNAFMPHMVIDAKISTDQQYMWYVLAFSEATDSGTVTFDDPDNPGYPYAYWADKKMKFDATDRSKVIALVDNSTGSPIEDTKVSGAINVWFYPNGSNSAYYSGQPSAISILSDATTGGGIASADRWSSTDAMTDTVFCVVRLKYDQNAGVTGLAPITARISNSLTKPGSVIYDYLTNTRYGCGMDPDLVDAFNLTVGTVSLDGYSDGVLTYTDNGVTKTQPRYRINGPVSTNDTCLNNLLKLTDSCDSWLKWDEQIGMWTVTINRSFSQEGLTYDDLFVVYADRASVNTTSHPGTYYGYVVGGVDITPVDLNGTYNRVECQFPSKLIRDQTDYAYIDLPEALRNPNEPTNSLTLSLPQVNDSVQAQYIGVRRLESARDDLIVSMVVDYSAIQVDAGDVIRVYHHYYGWDESTGFPYGKLFRVIQVQETMGDDGNLNVKLTLNEYNDSIYYNSDINAFQPAPNTGMTDPTVISAPAVPTTSNVITTASIPQFTITATVPTTGSVYSLEYWYALAPTASPPTSLSSFKLLQTQSPSGSSLYTNGATVTTIITALPASGSGNSYFFRIRAVGATTKSGYSNNSTAFTWAPTPTATVTGQNFQTSFQPSPVTVGVFANGQPDVANVKISLFGLSGAGQVDYTDVSSNGAMLASSWRIDIANIVKSGIDIGSPEVSTSNTYAVWPAPSALTANVASLTVPVIYKDSTGNTYNAPPSILNINKTVPGQQGSRGVVTLAYVSVDYDPTTANTTQLSGSFYTTTGFTPPIERDGAVFYVSANGLSSTRQYDSANTVWNPAIIEIPGNVILANSITGDQLTSNTITGNNLQISAVNTVHLANNAVDNNKIANNAVTTVHISTNAVTGIKINSGAISSEKISANAIVANTIASDAIQSRHISTESITAGKIVVGSLTADRIAANTITANNIAGNTITGNKIAANTITGTNIVAGTIDASKIQAFTITAGQIDAGTITGQNIRANTINFDNLVIGAVTQSKSTISEPSVAIQPFYNWPSSNKTWPDNTRCILPAGGVTIVPSTNPQSSANTEYTEGSRIEVSFSVKLYTAANSEYNMVELWKSGASSTYDRGFNSIRHTYNWNGGSQNQQIRAYGYGTGMDWVSYNGGASWSQYAGNTTVSTVTGATDYFTNNTGTNVTTFAVGPITYIENAPKTSIYLTMIAGRNSNNELKFQGNGLDYVSGAFTPVVRNYTNSMLSVEIAPSTGGDGADLGPSFNVTAERILTGVNGDIFWRPVFSFSSSYYRENVTNLLKDLYSSYSNKKSLSSNVYTAMICGQSGVILKSVRSVGAQGTWQQKQTHLNDANGNIDYTRPLLSDLYSIAGDDGYPASNNTWVAVGQYSVIMVSTDDGESWKQVATPTTQDLNAVRYCNGTWIAVGVEGVILTSTDPTTTWTQYTSPTPLSLNTIDYSYVWDRVNIGGQGIILTSARSPLNFVIPTATNFGPTETYDLTRLTYFGSWPLVTTVAQPPLEQRILNNQIFNSTTVDTAYVAGQETTYYLVIGNMQGAAVYAGQVFLQVTEVKR